MRNARFFKYVKSLGIFNGVKLFFQIRRANIGGIIKFKLPGMKYPTFMRRESSDFSVFEEIFIDNQYHFLNMSEAKVIIDAGANIGLSSLFLAKRYPNASIICVEPEIENYSLLLKNTKEYPNIICINKALWSTQAPLKIKNLSTDSWGFEIIETKNKIGAIEAITISEILNQYNFQKIDILKIDIEGSEKEVFESGKLWIDLVECIIVEIHENMRPGSYNAVMSLISENKYYSQSLGNLYVFKRCRQKE